MAITALPGWKVDPNNPNGVIRDLNFQSGDSAAALSVGRNQSQAIAESAPDASKEFSLALIELLKRHQRLGTRPFAQQAFNAQEQQINRVSQQTPQSLIGASPQIQSAVRSASASAVSPTIQGAEQGMQTFSEQIGAVGSAIEQARLFGREMEEAKEKERNRAASIIELAVQQGSSAIEELIRTSPDLFKRAGFNTKEFEAVLKGLKAKEAEDARRFAIEIASKTTTQNKPLSGDAAKIYAISSTLIPEAEKLKQYFQRDYRGSLNGIVFGTNRELVKLVDQVADKVGRLRSGGAVNKEEERRFKRQIASFLDIPFGETESAITALDGLIQEANVVQAGITSGVGGAEQALGNANEWVKIPD